MPHMQECWNANTDNSPAGTRVLEVVPEDLIAPV